jgi:L-lactate dehydrogenase complex protein LldG
MTRRRAVLGAIRRALGSDRIVPPPPPGPEPEFETDRAALLDRFVAEAEAVDAVVVRGRAETVLAERFGAEELAGALRADVPIDRERREAPLAITRAEWAIADTGTVVELHPVGSESAASAVVLTHVAVVSEDRILPDLATFYRRFAEALEGSEEPRYAAMITGPSRTADIEQTLVLGAHGPLDLLIVVEPPG